jgi:chromate reductase
MTNYTVGYFVGSLSSDSINRRLALALARLAPVNLTFVEIPIGELPLYNRDFDAAYPPVGLEYKALLATVDALLFVTPEYNRSIPGALSNAIDWASRPWGTNSFSGKPSATIGTSPGGIGTAVGQQHLKNILQFSDAPVMGQPEGYIQAKDVITAQGEVTDEATAEFLTGWIAAFAAFVQKQLR